MRHYWKKGYSARAATKEICDVEGDGAVSKSTTCNWFRRFQNGDINLEDRHRTGRPPELDDEALLEELDEEPSASTRDVSAVLCCHHSTIDRHLQHLGLETRRPREIPHELTPEQAQRRVDVCKQLLENPMDERFLKRIVTCDEKWVYLRNPYTRKQWTLPDHVVQPVAKRGRFEPKVMLSVWWNFQGIIHYELVPGGRAVNADLYSDQLQRVHAILLERHPALVNRRRVLLQHDNARPHTSRRTLQQIQELGGIEVLPHPAYSPDLAPSDYHLFLSMAHFLRGRRFETTEDLETACQEFFASKSPEWYRKGMEDLARRWVSVVEHDGLYFES